MIAAFKTGLLHFNRQVPSMSGRFSSDLNDYAPNAAPLFLCTTNQILDAPAEEVEPRPSPSPGPIPGNQQTGGTQTV